MYEVIYRLLEVATFVVCLHIFSGEKIKLDIYNVGFIAVQLAFLQMIRDGIVSKEMYFVAYLICFIYVYLKFKKDIKVTVLMFLLTTVIIVFLQMIIYIPMSFINYIVPNESFIITLINAVMLLIIVVSRKSKKYISVLEYCKNRDWILRICLLLCVIIMSYCMFSLKKSEVIKIDIFVLVSLFMTIFLIFLYRWQKTEYEVERKERELEITNLYNNVFAELIETTRKRQHDFHNHMDAIYSMHLTANSIEELIDAQKEYCDNLVYENRYSKVLNCINNSTLSGFLYTKFIRAEACGIDIEYDVEHTGKTKISIYDLIEIIGILMDNAVEALKENDVPKKIAFDLKDYKGLDLCVRNPVVNISNRDIERFFINGFTTKSSGKGIGLSKVKEYQGKYKFDIFTRLIENDSNKWIEFRIVENI